MRDICLGYLLVGGIILLAVGAAFFFTSGEATLIRIGVGLFVLGVFQITSMINLV